MVNYREVKEEEEEEILDVRPLCSVVTSLLTDQEVPGSIRGSTDTLLYWKIIPWYVRTGRFCVLVHILPYAVFKGGPYTLLTTGQGGHTTVSVFIFIVNRNFLRYRALVFKSLAMVKVKKKGRKRTSQYYSIALDFKPYFFFLDMSSHFILSGHLVKSRSSEINL